MSNWTCTSGPEARQQRAVGELGGGIHLFPVALLYRSATAVTDSCRAAGQMGDIVSLFGGKGF